MWSVDKKKKKKKCAFIAALLIRVKHNFSFFRTLRQIAFGIYISYMRFSYFFFFNDVCKKKKKKKIFIKKCLRKKLKRVL